MWNYDFIFPFQENWENNTETGHFTDSDMIPDVKFLYNSTWKILNHHIFQFPQSFRIFVMDF